MATALLAGCGDDEQAGSAGGSTSLTITLDPDGSGGQGIGRAKVRCEGSGTALPPNACDLVEGLPPTAADPIPPNTACTEIFGGPDVVTAVGTLEGEAIDLELTRANGCEIERYDRWTPLLRKLFPGYRPGEALRP